LDFESTRVFHFLLNRGSVRGLTGDARSGSVILSLSRVSRSGPDIDRSFARLRMRLPKSKRSKSSYPFSVFSLPSPSDCLCLRRDMPGAATLRSRAAVAAAACLAVLAAAALLHRRRRRNLAPFSSRRLGVGGRPRRACEEEEKPQARFKRVLADNSYSPFKHLRRQSAQPGSAEGEGPLPPPQGARMHSWNPAPACGDLGIAVELVWLFACFRNSTAPLVRRIELRDATGVGGGGGGLGGEASRGLEECSSMWIFCLRNFVEHLRAALCILQSVAALCIHGKRCSIACFYLFILL